MTIGLGILAAAMIISESMNVYMLAKIKGREKSGLLPDYKQVEMFSNVLRPKSGRGGGAFLTKVIVNPELNSQLEELKQDITAKDFENSWNTTNEILERYVRTRFAVIGGLLALIIVIVLIVWF